MRRPRAYIAGPITSSGSLHENLHHGIMLGELVRKNFDIHPFIPHLYDFTKIVTGIDASWEDMLKMDENWITACDVLIALPGESKGKEREKAFARSRHIPVIQLRNSPVSVSRGDAYDDDWTDIEDWVDAWEKQHSPRPVNTSA